MKRRSLVFLFTVLMMSLLSGVVYANDIKNNNESVNVKEVPGKQEGTQILESEDNGYIQITQINQNSQNVKIYTTTFDGKVSLMGKAKKGTNITISIFNKKASAKEYEETANTTYTLEVGSTGDFGQLLELLEGDNKIELAYNNKTDSKEDKMVFFIKRETSENKAALKKFLVDIPTV